MRLIAASVLLLCAGCASMPQLSGDGLPLGKSGWQMTGGADFDKQVWFVTFWRPWGSAEKKAADDTSLIVLPE
jgi:hypothetical protein